MISGFSVVILPLHSFRKEEQRVNRLRQQFLIVGTLVVLGVFLLVIWVDWSKSPQSLLEDPPQISEDKEATSWRNLFSEADLDLLARVVHAEARGEPYHGQVSVAAVILNRVRHPEFPSTIPGVVYEPLAFTVVANGEVNKPAGEQAIEAAHAALNGLDPTDGALYFYNPAKTRSRWIRSRRVVKTIGKHVFAS